MLLEVGGLRAFYGQSQALHGLDFALAEGSIVTLLGANGAGKTTTLRALCGMVRMSGEIRFDGKSIAGRATEDIVRLGVAHVPEARGTFALRSPVRPNPIAASVVKLVNLDGTRLSVVGLDCLDGTPLLDIKPYFASTDAVPDARVGWHADRNK